MVQWEGVCILLVQLVGGIDFDLSVPAGGRGLTWLSRMIE